MVNSPGHICQGAKSFPDVCGHISIVLGRPEGVQLCGDGVPAGRMTIADMDNRDSATEFSAHHISNQDDDPKPATWSLSDGGWLR